MKKIFCTILFLLLFAAAACGEDFDAGFEGYVLSHVRKEMSPSWHIEALKAQAVLARTFEMKAGRGSMTGDADFSENSAPVQAVAETAGMVLKYNGELASVFYHADSGGATTTAQAVWGGSNLPYLVSKNDQFPTQSPNSLWQKSMTKEDFEAALLAGGLYTGSVTGFANIERDESGRIKSLEITGSAGNVKISGGKLRSLCGLKSTLVNFGDSAPKGVSQTAQSTAAATVYAPAARKKKIDKSTMPQAKQARLDWYAKNGVISVQELMEMLVHPENIDAQLQICESRLGGNAAAAAAKPSAAQKTAIQPQETTQVVTEYATEYTIGDTIVFTGRGWGHGVGLPQWQAKAMAENGWSFTQILEYYFPGLSLEHY